MRRGEALLENLPGIGTNLLAERLKDLRSAGFVEHDGTSYALTPRGAELEEAVLALARFGAPLLAERDPDDLWRASWNVVALRYTFRPERAGKLGGVLEYRVDGVPVQARIRRGTIGTSAEPRWEPDVVVSGDGDTLLALAAGELDPREAEAGGALAIEGDRRLFRASLRVFSPPSGRSRGSGSRSGPRSPRATARRSGRRRG